MPRRFATIRTSGGAVVAESCLIAENAWLRTKGLLGKSELRQGEGILLRPASSIHMFFMRFPIDAVFLARDLTVLKVVHRLTPWKMAARLGARAVLELPAGTCAAAGISGGDRLTLSESDPNLTPPRESDGTSAADALP